MQHKVNFFEKHPKKTLWFLVLGFLLMLYGLCSLKIINNSYTEFENKSIKKILHQYYVGKIIDNNIGRFIKLREHPPNQLHMERPSRNYLKHIASNQVERKYYPRHTDQYGFIGPSDLHQDPDFKIVFLGGSTTECLYMEETERFPYLVGRLLESTLRKKVNTYNGGVSGNESMHSLNILLNKVVFMKPDMVVLMHNINDLVLLRSQGTYGYTQSFKSHIQTSKNVFTRYQFPPNETRFDEKEITQAFQRNLMTFIAICRIQGIQPVLMTQANRVQDDLLYHRFNEVIRVVGKQQDVLVIDLANRILPVEDILFDSYHYTAKGSALAAQVIADHIRMTLDPVSLVA